MDPTTAVRTDALPAMATLIAPGAFASAPYAWAVLSSTDNLKPFLAQHESIALASAILLWIAAGFLIESVGSYVEVYWIDRPKADHAEMLATWWRYLRIAWKTEPVGQHYLRRMLVSFKFELNMSVAAAASIPGVLILGILRLINGNTTAGGVALLAIATAALFSMAESSAGVLAEVRKQLVRGVGEPPFDEHGNPRPTPAEDGAR
jgi:hypothetical protein